MLAKFNFRNEKFNFSVTHRTLLIFFWQRSLDKAKLQRPKNLGKSFADFRFNRASVGFRTLAGTIVLFCFFCRSQDDRMAAHAKPHTNGPHGPCLLVYRSHTRTQINGQQKTLQAQRSFSNIQRVSSIV